VNPYNANTVTTAKAGTVAQSGRSSFNKPNPTRKATKRAIRATSAGIGSRSFVCVDGDGRACLGSAMYRGAAGGFDGPKEKARIRSLASAMAAISTSTAQPCTCVTSHCGSDSGTNQTNATKPNAARSRISSHLFSLRRLAIPSAKCASHRDSFGGSTLLAMSAKMVAVRDRGLSSGFPFVLDRGDPLLGHADVRRPRRAEQQALSCPGTPSPPPASPPSPRAPWPAPACAAPTARGR